MTSTANPAAPRIPSYAHLLDLSPETDDLLRASGAFNLIAPQLERPNMLRAYRCIIDQSRAALRIDKSDDEAISIMQAHALTKLSVVSCNYVCAAAEAATYKNDADAAGLLAKTASLMYRRAFSDERYLRASAALWLPSVAEFYTKVAHHQPVLSEAVAAQLMRALPGNPQAVQLYGEIKQNNFRPLLSTSLQ